MISRSDIESLVQQIARAYSPERIILFGSYANGQPRPDSDVDLLVLMPTDSTPFRAAVDILNTTDPQFAVDLIVRTPEDARERYRLGDPLMREAMDHGRTMYEAAA